jgi:serine/threonine-protein kinase
MWAFVGGEKPETTVPEVVGARYDDASGILEQSGLVLRIRAEAYDDVVEKDIITEQTPVPGCRVKIGREVLVDVSLGSRNLTTPNVIGLDRSEGVAQLEALGLSYTFLNPVYSNVAPAGTVINQRPVAGAPIALGEALELICSAGPENISSPMPQLEGLPYDEALRLISESHLIVRRVSRTYQPGVTVPTVSSQYPIPDSQIRQGTEVLLTLVCPTSQESVGERSIRVSVSVPQSAGTVTVRIVVQDRYETHEVYSAQHTGPTTVERLITSYGRTTIKIYFDNRIIREETL